MESDTAELMEPISATRPTGVNLREDDDGAALYYRLKDARSSARVFERQADIEAERGPVAPEWRTIFDLARDLLRTRTKDIEIAVWLTEASLRLYGFEGLQRSFALLDGLVNRYWDALHSLDSEDMSAKVAPLAGLNGIGADGALIQPLRLAPITAPRAVRPATLWDYMVMRRRGPASPAAITVSTAARETDSASFKALYGAIAASLASYTSLTARLDEMCGLDSPPSSTIRTTLTEAADALRDISGLGERLSEGAISMEPPVASAPEPMPGPDVAQPPVAAIAAGPVILHNREDALRELSRIATFFREHEPNSPIGFSLDTLIRRARMPLGELMKELVPDASVRRAYLSAAGIWPQEVGDA